MRNINQKYFNPTKIYDFLILEGKKFLIEDGVSLQDMHKLEPDNETKLLCKLLPKGRYGNSLTTEPHFSTDYAPSYEPTYDGRGVAYAGCSIYSQTILAEVDRAKKFDDSRQGSEILDAFIISMADERFIEALKTVVESELEERPAMLDYLSDGLTSEEWDWMMDLMHPLSLDEFHQIRKAMEAKKKKARRNPSSTDIPTTTKGLLRCFWLPLVLWKKTSGEILDTINYLKSGDEMDDFDKDTAKLDKAIRELKWYRTK